MINHRKSNIDNCRVINLTRHCDPNGQLTEVENTPAYPFAVKRVFYIYDVPADTERGGHSHHQASQMIIAASGSFNVTVDDGVRRCTYSLDRPYKALYVEPGIWATLDNFSGGAVCLVLASEEYSEPDYVRDYNEFIKLTEGKLNKNKGVRFPFLDLRKAGEAYAGEVKEAVCNVLDKGCYVGGEEVVEFERELALKCNAPYAIGVSNGLDALRLIFRAYLEMGRLKPGDEVIVPANTYIATILAVTDCGLEPVFVEPSQQTLNLDTNLLEAALTERTKVILPVHLYGRVCWDNKIAEFARLHNLIVVEDNAQAIGALAPCDGLFGSRVSGALGHAGAFSFYPTKNIGAIGDAGAVVTHDRELAHVVAALRNYGSDRRYHNIYSGLNCRLDTLQAAVLRVKLRHLDEETEHRRRLARIYGTSIKNEAVKLPDGCETALVNEQCVWHQFIVRVKDRDDFRAYLLKQGVATDVHYATPPHLQPCYSRYCGLELPQTCEIADSVVSLPISRCTSESDCRAISEIINRYRR